MKRGFTCRDTQDDRYWSPQNPHLTDEVLLRPVKVGVRCPVSARIVGPVFFKETINCWRYLRVEGQHFQHLCDLWIVTSSFRTLSANRHINSSDNSYASGVAPVVVKLRTVNRPKKVRTSLYMYAYFLVCRLICSVFVSNLNHSV
jgi:hypothetical protein